MANRPANARPSSLSIWTVEDYYRVKDFYESRGLPFNPALDMGSPAEVHLRSQRQLQAAQNAPPAGARRVRAVDALGERTLIVPSHEIFSGTSDAPGPIVLDIEARTNTRLRDGENPVWFIRLHSHFMARRDPAANVSFADYCARRHADKVETNPTSSSATSVIMEKGEIDPLLALLPRVHALVVGRIEQWRNAIRRWSVDPAHVRGQAGAMPIPFDADPPLTRDEKIVLFAGIYDAYADGLKKINPWPQGSCVEEMPYAVVRCERIGELRKHWATEGWKVIGFLADLEAEPPESAMPLTPENLSQLKPVIFELARQGRELRAARFNIYKRLFPWFGPEMLAADLGQKSENAEATSAAWKRANAEWNALTNLPPLTDKTHWLAAGRAAGMSLEQLETAAVRELATAIEPWAVARLALLPPSLPGKGERTAENLNPEILQRLGQLQLKELLDPKIPGVVQLHPEEVALREWLATDVVEGKFIRWWHSRIAAAKDFHIELSPVWDILASLFDRLFRGTCNTFNLFDPRPHVTSQEIQTYLEKAHGLSADSVNRLKLLELAQLLQQDLEDQAGVHAATATKRQKRSKVGGRTLERDEHEDRRRVAERWERFSRNYKSLGYTRCSYPNFAAWATEVFDDMPSDDPEVLERMVAAFRKTPTPRNLI